MKNLTGLKLAAILIICGISSARAQYVREHVDAYFTTGEMPDLTKWLPAPPDSIINKFTYDVSQYMWGKSMRKDPVRAEIARRDAEYSLRYIIQEFSGPFGLEISREGTPEIYRVLQEGTATCDSICTLPKKHYMRRRPFLVFNEHTLTPDSEASLSRNGSFPSGHTILGWSAALLLTEINPAKADTLLARGLMYGESRVIVGAHWQSDVDAGYLAASAAYAKLHTSERFLEQMRKAREEFKRLTTPAVDQPQRRTARSARRAARQQSRAY
jgi:acid phosphatase (class A)